ncbi:hypothetical protein PG996_006104 [Apiospora saccharicola]|uniref:Uncharacterized protein n=1 Tax=Apiospora saccharicola TaxID=335842 RepID=A0ABR1VR35_9PEZI
MSRSIVLDSRVARVASPSTHTVCHDNGEAGRKGRELGQNQRGVQDLADHGVSDPDVPVEHDHLLIEVIGIVEGMQELVYGAAIGTLYLVNVGNVGCDGITDQAQIMDSGDDRLKDARLNHLKEKLAETLGGYAAHLLHEAASDGAAATDTQTLDQALVELVR